MFSSERAAHLRTTLFLVLAFALLIAGAPASAAPTVSGKWEISHSHDGTESLLILADTTIENLRVWTPSSRDFGSVTLAHTRVNAHPGPVQFTMHRQAGTFVFEGTLGWGQGSGTFVFSPNAQFVADLAERGLGRRNAQEILSAALMDLTTQYIDDIHAAGYPDLSYADLITFRAIDVTPNYVHYLAAHGFKRLAAKQVIELKSAGL